jgi:tight adherence protein C
MTPAELLALGMAGLGLYLVLSALPIAERRPSLEERLRRFDVDARLRGHQAAVAQHSARPLLPWAPLDAALRPLLEDLAGPVQRLLHLDGLLGSALDRPLRVLHPGTSRHAFVARQLLWGVLALALFLAVFASRDQLGVQTLIMSLLAGGVGCLLPWLRLRRQARARRRRLLAELPHVARLLAMGMSASLPLDVALAHVGTQSRGPLGQLIARAVSLAAVGNRGLLPELARRAALEDLPELASFVGLLQASDAQGLPLAASLETMASTLQERAAARLLAAAERGTLKMIFPLALVLSPVVVAVTFVPALLALFALVHGGS